MEKEDLFTLMGMFMKANEKRIKPMAKEFTFTQTGLGTKETGNMINNMESELRPGQMAQNMKEATQVGKKMAKGNLAGLMEACIMESFLITIFMDLEFIAEVMAGSLKATGKITKWTEKESSLEVMEEAIVEST